MKQLELPTTKLTDMGLVQQYRAHGYKDRAEYLNALALEYDIPVELVYALAESLGPTEDFDGLICTLDDAEENFEYLFDGGE